MNPVTRFLDTLVVRWALTYMVASAVVLGLAWTFQYGFDYIPCELCYYQRYPYMLAFVVAGIAFIARRRPDFATRRAAKGFLIILVFLMVLDALMAAFHVGVEKGLWEGPSACSAPITKGMTAEQLRQAILEAPVVTCADPAWTLFGLSMAGYNFLIAIALAAFGIYAFRRIS